MRTVVLLVMPVGLSFSRKDSLKRHCKICRKRIRAGLNGVWIFHCLLINWSVVDISVSVIKTFTRYKFSSFTTGQRVFNLRFLVKGFFTTRQTATAYQWPLFNFDFLFVTLITLFVFFSWHTSVMNNRFFRDIFTITLNKSSFQPISCEICKSRKILRVFCFFSNSKFVNFIFQQNYFQRDRK